MSLSPEERQAVQESRDHWERDICVPLRNGDSITEDLSLSWESDGKPVPISGDSCALCQRHTSCRQCPLFPRRKACGNPYSPYGKFWDNPTLKNAEAMRDALQEILDEEGA
jgi:hypothetical protein